MILKNIDTRIREKDRIRTLGEISNYIIFMLKNMNSDRPGYAEFK